MERRLAAVLSADVAGYSRLMGDDEARTLAVLKAHREELVDPKIAEHHGRVVKLMGVGALVEFPSVVDAVTRAVEIQRGMVERNAGTPEERRIEFRIGINLGDIIIEGDDIYGDGVNVAARLQELAEPGGICIRRAVRNQVRDKLPHAYEDLGEIEVKNIARPVRVFRVSLDAAPAKAATPRTKRRWLWPVALAAPVAVAAVVAAALYPWAPSVQPASVERMAHPLPDKPSIVVLPFDNLSDDPSQAYFADGMTEDLITDLAQLPGVFVISRNSSFTYKGKPTKVQKVAEDLGVRYVVEGSVRRVEGQIRINAQLVDALNGHHLWAERFDGALSDVFALQDRVIARIVAALAVNLAGEAAVQRADAETDVPRAYDAFLEGREYLRRKTPENNNNAAALFEEAIALDPDYGMAYAALASAYWDDVVLTWELAIGRNWQRAYDKAMANLAKALERPTSGAYAVSARVLTQQGRYEEALAELDRAIALDPNDPDVHVGKARLLNATGQAAAAEESVRLAMRLDPHYPADYLRALGQSLFHQERYVEAADVMNRVIGRQPDVAYDYTTLAAIYGHLGRAPDAEAAIRGYDAILTEIGYTPMTVQEMGYWWYGDMFDYDETYRHRLVEGLRKAGARQGAEPEARYAAYKALMSRSAGEYIVDGATRIDAPAAKALHERGVVIVDVRDAGSFSGGHIPGAVHLDLNTDPTEANLLRYVDRNDEVVFHCWGKYCPYSAYASAKAITWGFIRVYYFAGGMPAWEDAGYPIETAPGS